MQRHALLQNNKHRVCNLLGSVSALPEERGQHMLQNKVCFIFLSEHQAHSTVRIQTGMSKIDQKLPVTQPRVPESGTALNGDAPLLLTFKTKCFGSKWQVISAPPFLYNKIQFLSQCLDTNPARISKPNHRMVQPHGSFKTQQAQGDWAWQVGNCSRPTSKCFLPEFIILPCSRKQVALWNFYSDLYIRGQRQGRE